MKTFAATFAIILLSTTAHAKGHHHHGCRHHSASNHTRHHHQHNDSPLASMLIGQLEIDGHLFDFVSGGRGRGAIPYGDYEITPNDVGSWGARHGALGLNHGDSIPDKKIGKDRDGIEIHAAVSSYTAGCIGIRNDYPKFKSIVRSILDKKGHAWLHIRPDKQAVTDSKEWPEQIAVY